jgi:hypothetical protein
MLSPNAANRVRVIIGAGSTVMPKVHDAVRCRASVAVQVTVVGPMGNTV